MSHVAEPGGYLLAADVGGTRVRMLLAHRDGIEAARWQTHLPDGRKYPAGVLSLLRTGADAMLATVPAAPLLHVTVGAPGVTDVRRGVVVAAPNLPGWTDVPLREMVQAEFGVPAAVDNDTNLAALGEGAAGAAQGVPDYVFVAMGTGVGAGIVAGGQLLRGAHGLAGEIGYLQPAAVEQEPVRMDELGALERQIGGLGIERRWRELLAEHAHAERLNSLHAPEIFDRAEAGDALAQEVMRWTADLLTGALTTLVLVLDPALIVLGAGVGAHAALCTAVQEAMQRHSMPVPRIVPSALRAEAQLHGAVATSLSALSAEYPQSAPPAAAAPVCLQQHAYRC